MNGVHSHQVEREQKVPAHHVEAEGCERLVRNAPFLFPDEEDSAGMQSQPTDTQRAQFEPLEHAMGFAQLVKGSRHQMCDDHEGNEKESEVHLHVGFQMEAKDAADENHGDLADDHREFPPVDIEGAKKVSH